MKDIATIETKANVFSESATKLISFNKIKGGAHRNTNSMSVVSNSFEFILSTKKLNIDKNDNDECDDDSWSCLQEDDDEDLLSKFGQIS
jgi:hypothetical protein